MFGTQHTFGFPDRRSANDRTARALVIGAGFAAGALVLTAAAKLAQRVVDAREAERAQYRPGHLRVVDLGDSVPAGAACLSAAFPELVNKALARRAGLDVDYIGYSSNGATSSDVLRTLRRRPVLDAIAASDVTIVMCGANDLDADLCREERCTDQADADRLYDEALTRTMSNIADAVQIIVDAQRHGRQGRCVVVGYWNVFADGEVGAVLGQAHMTGSDALTKAFNERLATEARTMGVTYVDVYGAFKGDGSMDPSELLAADGEHPNAFGHQVLSQAVLHELTSADQSPDRRDLDSMNTT